MKREWEERMQEMQNNAPDRDFFREEAEIATLYKRVREKKLNTAVIPENVEKSILFHAAAALGKQRDNTARKKRYIFTAFAAGFLLAVLVFAGLELEEKMLPSDNRELAGIVPGRKKAPLLKPVEQKTKPHSSGEYSNYASYTENYDAANYELISLSTLLDMAAMEAELSGYNS